MNEQQRKHGILEHLKHSLQALALPAAAQLAHLPDFVVKTDELVLDFDHWRDCAVENYRGEMTEAQLRSLETLASHIENPSGDRTVWEDNALFGHPFWATVRTLAIEALNAFGWPQETPPSEAHQYVRGKANE